MPAMRIIDVHLHLYPDARIAAQAMGGTSRHGFAGTPEDTVEFMREHNIAVGVMCNFTPIHDMHVANLARIPAELTGADRAAAEAKVLDLMRFRVGERNEWSLQASERFPQLLTFIGVDPVLSPDEMQAEVELRHAAGAKGIKLHPPVQRVRLDDERWSPALAAAERLGMVILTHMGPFGGIEGDWATIEDATKVAERFPNLRMILAHAGGPNLAGTEAALQRFPNLVVDTVGLAVGAHGDHLSDEEVVAQIRRFGADRVVFGSDYCFVDPRPTFARLDRLPLTPAEREAIYYDNAATLLGITG